MSVYVCDGVMTTNATILSHVHRLLACLPAGNTQTESDGERVGRVKINGVNQSGSSQTTSVVRIVNELFDLFWYSEKRGNI